MGRNALWFHVLCGTKHFKSSRYVQQKSAQICFVQNGVLQKSRLWAMKQQEMQAAMTTYNKFVLRTRTPQIKTIYS